jgi:hypothetical protein
VRVGGDGAHRLSITRNLDVALRHLRYRSEPCSVWVDATCINQKDDQEKSEQVASMFAIYGLARRVVMWLGPAENESDDALDLLRDLGAEVEVDWNRQCLQPSSQCTSEKWADQAITLPFLHGELIPVWSLLQRPYFRRAWIRQETRHAKKAIIYCGSGTITWADFRTAVACIIYNPIAAAALGGPEQRKLFVDCIQAVYDLCRLYKRNLFFFNLRYTQRVVECQDDRDRIYSILSLLDEPDSSMSIKPDYSLSAAEVYTDVADLILIKQLSLTFLDTCNWGTNSLSLPSWVPDWSISSPVQQDIFTKWSACGWISAQAYVEGRILCAKGFAKAQVEFVAGLKHGEPGVRDEVLSELLRQLRPDYKAKRKDFSALQDILRNHALAFTDYWTDKQSEEDMTRVLSLIWSGHELEELAGTLDVDKLHTFWDLCSHAFVGRCFFRASNGYYGLAPADTQKGDTICVFLGCKHPVVIRPVPSEEERSLWRVVGGAAIVPGLMHGEAIYGDRLPRHYTPVPVRHTDRAPPDKRLECIHGFDFAMHDTVNDVFINDPRTILEETGIKVERYQRWQHELEVLPESPKAVGVELEEFMLV